MEATGFYKNTWKIINFLEYVYRNIKCAQENLLMNRLLEATVSQ